jgi:hypothetical protein
MHEAQITVLLEYLLCLAQEIKPTFFVTRIMHRKPALGHTYESWRHGSMTRMLRKF